MIPIVVVVMIVPVVLRVPPVLVFIPPLVIRRPAMLPRFVQFMPRVFGLLAVPAVVLHRFVKPVVGPGDAPLAIVGIRAQAWGSGEEKKRSDGGRGKRDFS
jgi:hypothetical protein